MMTARQARGWVGRRGLLLTDGLKVEVKVLDAREVFGRRDYLVRPSAGKGVKWVSAERVELTP